MEGARYNTIHHILSNPIYAGAYAYGRSASKTRIANGRKQVVRGFRVERSDWEVLIRDHHEGYIGWDAFERNQRLINDNANGKSWASRGAVRRGEALLAGLFRCGHCGRKLHVAYSGTKGDVARYHCRGALINHGVERCISFGSLRVDSAVAAEVIERIQPLGVEASLAACRRAGAKTPRSAGRSNWRSSRRVSKRRTRDGSMTPSIPTTDWLPENWSDVGTSA